MNTTSMKLFAFFTLLVSCLATPSLANTEYEEITYYHNDALGSPVAATDANGALKWREEYTPYGSRLLHESRETTCGNNTCPQKQSLWDEKQWFTGKLEETPVGVQYFGARWYEPEIGRFISPDPVQFHEENVFSFNSYAYANNNPYAYIDPDGRAVETGWDLLNVGMGIASFAVNVSTGNYPAAALDAVGVVIDSVAVIVPGIPGGASYGINAARAGGKALEVTKGPEFYRGAKPGSTPDFTPRPNEFKVDATTGTVKPTHGVSVFDNPGSVSSKGFVPHKIDQGSVPDSLQIIQRGKDPSHFEITPKPGANLTPKQFSNACSQIKCGN